MSEKSLRSRTVKPVIDNNGPATDDNMSSNGTTTNPSSSSSSPAPPARASTPARRRRNPPHLPTPTELLALGIYPVLLTFGTLFSVFNPEARGAPYDPYAQSHFPGTAPSYFARKDNLLNVLFVKKGWAWFTGAFLVFLFTHPTYTSLASSAETALQRRLKAGVRYALVTGWWILVTQWCFGPALIDRGFRYTGGKCEVAQLAVHAGEADTGDALTAVACKAAGGRWSGGHDISGHVFLLMLGSWFLVQEVGWVILRASGSAPAAAGGSARTTAGNGLEERTVVMADGAVKGASVEAAAVDGHLSSAKEGQQPHHAGHVGLGLGGKFAAAIVVLSYWMLLMTAIYFHTWFEKVTGFLVAFAGMYSVYILPRFVPPLRGIVGMPGI
ncbi:inositol phospholipid synthesis and fat-storage-inducing TM-domain-containing protein [Microdochium trichocladiopsis]|uniref:Acyl-coenzyme A diphosphatase SCS3 n=1 Tax=Microdochium trichocladiopsis TaxID=1682393 RepID=A0A9P8YF04_9PEZI|nr:inositol phospholipid synthesis and fat-storage-inducing TM-domain-containing protein [Microdochium trichocladiopsis]KAH7037702.1 inositol phospholipid synthesis and fat-storage-inducing TM-domain-containing protein [Microdochium trichocladiopsis]